MGIESRNIEEGCVFACGACSCQIKQENPGVDLLLAFDWQSKIVGSAMKQPELPELSGIGILDVNDAVNEALDAENRQAAALTESRKTLASTGDSNALDVVASRTGDSAATDESSAAFENAWLMWAVGIVLVVGMVVGVTTTFLWKKDS
jgi:hypothetical protein